MEYIASQIRSKMKVAQISDLHIGFENEATMLIDVRKNFQKTLKAIADLQPDILVVSGDLCYRQAEKEVYEWIRIQLDSFNIPYFLISGNHDNSSMLAKSFGIEQDLHDGELYFSKIIGNQTIIFLDTSLGFMSDAQYVWLQKELQASQFPIRIFMHHPPMHCGVRFMDNKYAFLQTEKLMPLFLDKKTPISIFCGHYHVPIRLQHHQVEINICPSSYFHLNPFIEEFEIVDDSIGFAWIEFEENSNYHYKWMFDKAEKLNLIA